MRIPFFSKKTKQILKENEDRIFLLTEEQQEKVLADPKFDAKAKITQLLKENNELKLLYDNLQDELSNSLRAGGNYVLEVASNTVELIGDVKVLQDSQLEFKKKKVDVDAPDKVLKWKSLGRIRQARVWFVETEGEYTYDARDETPIEIKKRSEAIIKVKNETTKASFIQNILKGLSAIKKWWDYIPWIMFGVTISFIVLAFVWLISGYNLTK